MRNLTTVLLNDIHAGSEYAIKHPSGGELNDSQKVLYSFWKELARKWHRPDCLILNGDLIDGLAFRGNMADTWSKDLMKQADNSIALIRMFNAKKIFVVRGTPYHTQTEGVDLEEYIGKELGAQKEGKRYSTEVKLIDLSPNPEHSRIVHVAHHLNGSKWFMYRGTALSREMAQTMLNETHFIDRTVHDKIFGIVRAHNHYYWYSESASRIMLSCPAWQLPTPFTLKVMPATQPDIGAVRFTVDEEGVWHKEHKLLKTKALLPTVHNA